MEMEGVEGSGGGGSSDRSLLEQPWAVTDARGEAAPPLIDIPRFRQEWMRTLTPMSPRIDHLHLLGDPLDGHHDMIGDDAEEHLVPLPDLSCDDIFIGTARQQIQAAIQAEIASEENKELLKKGLLVDSGSATLLLRGKVPNAVKLAAEKEAARSTLLSLKEKHEAEKDAATRKRKEVNYLTPNVLDLDAPEYDAIAPDEVILAVCVYHHKKQVKTQEFFVLGSQPMHLLRDRIICVADLLPEPNSRSGFFFFENVFYDDMRDPANIRYSSTIIDWANTLNSGERPPRDKGKDRDGEADGGTGTTTQPSGGDPLLGGPRYSARNMEDTRWDSLKVRIGVPYLYCHQGNCEHRIIITDIRLPTRDDEKNRHAYPVQTFQSKIRRKKCVICDIYPATYLTYNDEFSPQNPCFFCEKCYVPFHYAYDSRGTLLHDHDVFTYHHE